MNRTRPPAPRGASGRARVIALLAALLLCAAALVSPVVHPNSGSPGSSAQAAEPKAATVRLLSAPASIGPTTAATVRVEVTAGDTPIPADWSVLIGFQSHTLDSRQAVEAWSGTSLRGAIGNEVARLPLTNGVPAGQSRELIFSFKAGGLNTSRWGPHGTSIVLVDGDDTRQALLRTYLVTDPGTPAKRARTKVSVLLPITASGLDPQTGYADRNLLAETAPGGRVSRLLQLAERPGVTTVLDPALLTLTPDPANPSVTGEPEEALQNWRDRVRSRLQNREVIGLPYADPDVLALSEADQFALGGTAQDLATATFAEAGFTPRTDIAVPIGGVADAATIEAYTQLGRTAGVVLDDRLQTPDGDGYITATGRGEASYAESTAPTLIADHQLADELQASAGDGPAEGVAATQRLLADTALIASQQPDRQRHLLVLLDRDVASTPETTRALQTLTDGPWTTPGTVAELLAADPVERSQPVLSDAQRAQALSAKGIDEVMDEREKAANVLSVLDNQDSGAQTQQRLAVRLISVRWRGYATQWKVARDGYARSVQQLVTAIRVVPGSTITQVSRNVRLPVTVQNDTGAKARVQLQVTPQSNRLVVVRQVAVDVAAHSRAVAYVPVRGVGNGDTGVTIRLLTADGRPLGEPAVVKVNVRADWESTGTWTMGVIAALLLLIGLIRSVRRGPRIARHGHNPLAEHPTTQTPEHSEHPEPTEDTP